MRGWENLPEMASREHFTAIELPEDAIAAELEQLTPVELPVLAVELMELRASAFEELETTPLRVRKSQKELGSELELAFRNAVEKLVDDGTYATLVRIHADMSHNMHGSMGLVGLLRFLPWHRQYLLAFEELLIAADRELRPNASERLYLPFWHWVDPFPDWLSGFLPSHHPDTGSPVPSRARSQPPPMPDATDIDLVSNQFDTQLPGVSFPSQHIADYVRFTYALEGWGERSDGSPLPAHNHVHDWVGGIMSDTSYSPTDPVFWLHHAEVDRLWAMWQSSYPNAHPPLTGSNRILDPWTATYDTVRSVEAMGYTYGLP